MITIIFVASVCFCFSIGKGNEITSKKNFFIYDWPDLVDRYANSTDRPHHSHGVEFPQWKSNFGAGRLIRRNISEYRTSQFALFKLMYERALIDPRRTKDPSAAGSFIIPYDFGMDATFMELNGRMRRTNCPLANQVVARLKQSPYFLANEGHDHTLIISVNQHMNYFFNAKACTELLMLCWNCTKISIDDYIFVAKNREFELKTRGINWHAVPFPSDYHYDSRVFGHSSHSKLPSWETKTENRSHLVSYLGNPRKFSALSSSIREALVIQCMNNSDVCTHGNYNHEAHESPNYDSRRSVFCLQPPGDMPPRKSVFDVLLSGCIPVFFHPLTARYMYEWHWSPQVWSDAAVHFDSVEDTQRLLSQSVDFVQQLRDMYAKKRDLVEKKRQTIREHAYKLQYSLIYKDPINHKPVASYQLEGQSRSARQDAYEITMSNILDIHYGYRSHDRVAPYVACLQIAGGGKTMLQTVEGCNVTRQDVIKDPFSPPAAVSTFFGMQRQIRNSSIQY